MKYKALLCMSLAFLACSSAEEEADSALAFEICKAGNYDQDKDGLIDYTLACYDKSSLAARTIYDKDGVKKEHVIFYENGYRQRLTQYHANGMASQDITYYESGHRKALLGYSSAGMKQIENTYYERSNKLSRHITYYPDSTRKWMEVLYWEKVTKDTQNYYDCKDKPGEPWSRFDTSINKALTCYREDDTKRLEWTFRESDGSRKTTIYYNEEGAKEAGYPQCDGPPVVVECPSHITAEGARCFADSRVSCTIPEHGCDESSSTCIR